eukprot:GILJ01002698.1.p1 GENE.GILJ01002698.1~~GILJ01002698.1.p1  ORF type:complete len:231 (+),score=31.12 GILJ01002698.1:68-760(+)
MATKILISVFVVALVFVKQSYASNFDFVTCGSSIKLKHVATGFRLHSHDIKWGTGSGQQSVTGFPSQGDVNSMWNVKEGHGEKLCLSGEPVKCGSLIRLQHAQTRRNLHSHLFESPLSKQTEVTCFGEDGRGDTGDTWRVECLSSSSDSWLRTATIRFKHQDTGHYLHSHDGYRFNQNNCPNCPIMGQQEVTAFHTKNKDNLWQVDDGVFLPLRDQDESKVASDTQKEDL